MVSVAAFILRPHLTDPAGRFVALLISLCCGLLLCATATAQDRVYPTVLYSGTNPITIHEGDGISKIEIRHGGEWKQVAIGQKTSRWKVTATPIFTRCAKKVTVNLFVERIDVDFDLELRVTDCDGSRTKYTLGLENTWTLFHEDFGTVTMADKPCHTFSVQSLGGDFIIEKVTSSSKQFTITYPFAAPPLRIQGSKTYRYSVCFKPLRTGRIKVPINVHIRRNQPVGSHTTYIVADTAYVNVIASSSSEPNNPPRRDPPVFIEPPPKPKPPRLPPGGPTEPPRPRAQAFDIPIVIDDELIEGAPVPSDTVHAIGPTPVATLPEFVHDPTTFRTILSPSARSLGKGRGFAASYDGAGLLAGYGATERLTLIGGGILVPPGIADLLAVTGGAKYEVYRGKMVQAAVGAQVNFSSTAESQILSAAPYATARYGTDDYAVSATVGWSWRRHVPSDTIVLPFVKRAALAGVAADYRFAEHWKIAAESFIIADSEFQPLAVTLRWFSNRLAIDAGAAIDLTPTDGLLVLPVVSGIYTF